MIEGYKDSGVEWIGEIPEDWKIKQIKRYSIVKRGASPRPIDDPVYFDDDGEFAWVRIADVTASNQYLETTTQILSDLGVSLSVKQFPGDLFISIAGTVGKPIITKIKCCIHDGFILFDNPRFDKLFLYFIFLSGKPYQGLGKLGTQLNLNTDTIGQIYIPIPSKDEQKMIADYLNEKVSFIDKAMELKKKQLEKLDDLKKSVIHKAVTKGLDDSVNFKDSGIDWIGKIPQHWKSRRLKDIGRIKYGLGQPPQEMVDGLPLIRATNVNRGKIDPNNLIYVDPEDIPFDRDPILRKNDIIVVRSGAYTADSAIIPETYDGAITGYDMVLRCFKNISPQFISFILLSKYVLEDQLKLLTLRAAQPHLNREELGSTVILLPPLKEQKQIALYLDKKTAEIDSVSVKIKLQIEKLEQYKKSLIHECVTGKRRIIEKDVKEAV